VEASLDESEVCPNCGHLDVLHVDTGWCASCTTIEFPHLKICTTCGALYPKKAQVDNCWLCRKEAWLSKHGDRIEAYLVEGLSFTAACERVADDLRPTCKNCGDEIRGGRSGINFCNKRPECRKASNQFRTLQQQGLTPDDALVIVTRRVLIYVSNTQTGE
jgi:hypothetical protein